MMAALSRSIAALPNCFSDLPLSQTPRSGRWDPWKGAEIGSETDGNCRLLDKVDLKRVSSVDGGPLIVQLEDPTVLMYAAFGVGRFWIRVSYDIRGIGLGF